MDSDDDGNDGDGYENCDDDGDDDDDDDGMLLSHLSFEQNFTQEKLTIVVRDEYNEEISFT